MWNPFKRDWQLIDKTVLESGFEQIADRIDAKYFESFRADPSIFSKTVVYVFQCQITKKIKHIVVRS